MTTDTERGDDAQDHVPRPRDDASKAPPEPQEAKNYEGRDDEGAIEVENMSSANDEGAN